MNSPRLPGSTQVERHVPDLDSDTEVYDDDYFVPSELARTAPPPKVFNAVDVSDGG